MSYGAHGGTRFVVLCVRKRFFGEGVVVLPGNDAFHLVDASHYSHDRKSCALIRCQPRNRLVVLFTHVKRRGPVIALGVVAEAYVFYRLARLVGQNEVPVTVDLRPSLRVESLLVLVIGGRPNTDA